MVVKTSACIFVQNRAYMLAENMELRRKSGPPRDRGRWRGGLLSPGVSWYMARLSSWFALVVSEGRG